MITERLRLLHFTGGRLKGFFFDDELSRVILVVAGKIPRSREVHHILLDISMTDATTNEDLAPIDAVKAARKLWLSATNQSDLDEVERLYRWALSSKTKIDGNDINNNGDNQEDGPQKKKIKKSGHCGLNRKQFNQAGEKLALLLCQSGRCKKAKKGLEAMGFICRLARQVLDYPTSDDDCNNEEDTDVTIPKLKKCSSCQIIDGFLSNEELVRLRLVFANPEACYWTDHNYAVEPPSPYFSWVISLDDLMDDDSSYQYGFLGDLIEKILSCPLVNDKFPQLEQKANFVEIWAHNRPHASGHQLVRE